MGARIMKRFLLVLFILSVVTSGLLSDTKVLAEDTFINGNNHSSNSKNPVPESMEAPGERNSVFTAVNTPVTIFDILRAAVVSTPWFQSLKETPSGSVTSSCSQALVLLIKATLSGEKWTIPFADSSGKPGPSVFKGWLNFIGNYDQCQEATTPTTALAQGFRGEYFAITLSTNILLLTSRVDLCLPDTCTEPEIASVAASLLNASANNLGLKVITVESIRNETEVTAATVCCIVVLSILGCLVLLGTTFELVQTYMTSAKDDVQTVENGQVKSEEVQPFEDISMSKNYKTIAETVDHLSDAKTTASNRWDQNKVMKPIVEFCLTFSAYKNGIALLKVGANHNSLSSIHGLKFLSSAWVILAHTYYYQVEFSLNKSSISSDILDRWSFGPAANAFISVDTFFVVSGVLVAYHTLNEINKKGWKIDWARFYLHRYWRLTPPYMLVLLTSLGLTQYLGKGSLWSDQQPFDKEKCEDKWWKNILYISNVDGLFDECMGHCWYLACNMQYYFLSPLMIVPFYFHYAAGIASCFAFLLASWIATGVLSSKNDWSANGFIDFDTIDDTQDYVDDYYVKPWNRIGPFVIGIITGYILTKTKGRSLNIKWWIVALGWLVCTATALAVVYGLHGDISGQHPSSTGVAALYNSVARSAWGVSISWIILACDAGYGGPVNAILSWSPFVVLGRLSYMVYLIHPYIISIVYANFGYLIFYTDYTLSIFLIGFTTFSNFASFFLMLLFETPMVKIEQLYFPKWRKE